MDVQRFASSRECVGTFIPSLTPEAVATAIRGLNTNHNHDLKNIFKGAAIRAAVVPGPFQEFYASLVAAGAPDNLVAGVIGHSSTSIVQTYAKVVDEYRRDAIRKLEAYRNEQQEKVASASASPRTSQPTESIPTI